MTLSVSARRLALIFSTIVGLLVLVHTVLQVIRFVTDDHRLMGLLALFSLGAEQAVPAYYSALALLFCSFLLAFIGVAEMRNKGFGPAYWFGLSFIFLFLSCDENLYIHERLIPILQPAFENYRALHYAWIVPYAAAVAVIGLVYIRFLLKIPRRTALQFIVAGTLFVGGAIGFEMVTGYYATEHGTMNPTYVVGQSIEEILEMSGIVLFLYALASYAQERFGTLELQLSADDS